eukprot:gene29941-37078_t
MEKSAAYFPLHGLDNQRSGWCWIAGNSRDEVFVWELIGGKVVDTSTTTSNPLVSSQIQNNNNVEVLDSRSSSVGDMSLTSDMMDFECDPSDANRLSDFSFDFNYNGGGGDENLYEPPTGGSKV